MIYGQPITFGGASGEIDITDNGAFDVKKYATANVNVEPVLLWTNASPTSAFAAQTVNVASGYDAYLVELVPYGSEQNVKAITYAKNGDSTTLSVPAKATTTYAMAGYFRGATCNNGKITFTTGYYYGYENSNNVWAIPVRVWGVKFTL